MNKKGLFLIIISLCMMILPTKMWADGSATASEGESKKTLPYPRATKAVPVSALEYDSIAECFVVRDSIVDATVRTLSEIGRASCRERVSLCV